MKLPLIAKTSLLLGAALFVGASTSLWINFGGSVYAARLANAFVSCL